MSALAKTSHRAPAPAVFALAWVLLACLPCLLPARAQSSGSASDEAAIREARRVQTQALARDDLDTVVKHWAPEITIRRALGQPVEGAAAARKLLEPNPNANPATRVVFQREAVSVSVSGHWPLAYEEGRWSGHVGAASGPVIMSGRYAAQWVKREGRWLIRSEIFVAIDCSGAGCAAQALP
jgi:ketosteroid isomerase-like protein